MAVLGDAQKNSSWAKIFPRKVWGNVQILFQDYKSLHAAVIICATLVNTQTHTQRDSF